MNLIDITPAKAHALIACQRAGVLTRSNGLWRGLPSDKPVLGITLYDLRREGLFDLDIPSKKTARAKLTAAGLEFAARLNPAKAE